MNLQKYTKAELISKFKHLQNKSNKYNYKDWINNIINYIILFKSFLLKITLITLLIKSFKKYSLLRKIWLIINYSILTIFGFSITDIYGSEFISNFLNYWRSTQFYSWISQLFGFKQEVIKETPSRLKSIDISSTTNQKTNVENNRIVEWFDKIRNKEIESETIEESNLKYYIIAGIIVGIAGCFIYTYWDDINLNLTQLYQWFRRRGDRPRDGGSGIGGNNPSNNNQLIGSIIPTNQQDPSYWESLKHKFQLWRRGNPETHNTSNISNNPISVMNVLTEEDISLEDNSSGPSQMDHYFKEESIKGKGKEVLTSPSLENLNSTAEQSWSESGTSSPKSTTSTETIKPIDPKTITEQVPSSSSTNQNVDNVIKSSGSIKQILNITELKNPITNDNFENYLNEDIRDNINFIESAFGDEVINKNDALLCVDKIVKLNFYYDEIVNYYNKNCSLLNIQKVQKLKELTFYMRQWLVDYNSRLYPDIEFYINLGTIEDNPKLIAKVISEQILANHS
uniref:Uncharacterized protein n=1 Tax=Lactifluus hygrophoroides TaxID=1837245 RepID=A0A2Z4M924_9AGAM|nr:hypothetical protein [Lactifluus hygrophoroides]AWX52958.1 hypothetical protein [Lactifluus hygrophoroides]